MNLGQYVTDLISLSNRLQKEAANTSDPLKLYQTTVELKDTAKSLQTHLVQEYLNEKGESLNGGSHA